MTPPGVAAGLTGRTAGARATLPKQAAALQAARQATVGDAFGKPDRPVPFATLVHAGWTPEVYLRLVVLAEHASRVQAWLAIEHAGRPRTMPVGDPRVLSRFVTSAETTAGRGAQFEQVEPWLSLLAGAATPARFVEVSEGLRWWGITLDSGLSLKVWDEQTGQVGALAWAAGLDLTEAAAQQAAGILDTATLRTLTALRGWHLPA